MERVLSIPKPRVNRRTVAMEPGDEALVFRISLPLGERRCTRPAAAHAQASPRLRARRLPTPRGDSEDAPR